MQKRPVTIAVFGLICFLIASSAPGGEKGKSTHEFSGTFRIPAEDQSVEIRTFCVDKTGRLLVATGGTQFVYKKVDGSYLIEQVEMPSVIAVLDREGKLTSRWKIDVTPEALTVAPDGSIYAAGLGKIIQLDASGKILRTVESPHLKELPPLPEITEAESEDTEESKKEKAARITELTGEMKPFQKRLSDSYKDLLAARKEKDQDKIVQVRLDMEKLMEQYKILYSQRNALQSDPKSLALQRRTAAVQARSVKSIAVTETDIFLCCPPKKGYSPVVWRMNHDFGDAQIIVKGLSGCCGQMNIATIHGKLVVPENGRMRVRIFERDGKALYTWGEDERDNAESGFGSCCNPMNLSFDKDGNILTSEASVGAVKRFSLDGRFLGPVAKSKIVPGCKHTPIGISPDGNFLYILDITQRQIVVMKKTDAN